VPVGLTGVEDFARALAAYPPDSRSRLYWTARVTLLRRHADVAAFDAVFAAVFSDAELVPREPSSGRPGSAAGPPGAAYASVPRASTEVPGATGLPWLTLPPVVAGADADPDAGPVAVPERLPSALEGLADLPFEELDASEMELLGRWLADAFTGWPARRTRRRAVDPAGHRIAIRPTIARSRRTGWEAVTLVRERPVRKPRRIVMLCDVSQSMQAQASAYFHLMRAVALVADAEVFAFATTLTRLTAVLAHRSAVVAIEQATATVTDRFGGTRIATNLAALLSSRHGEAVRGAIVVIGSDGWDSDPPERLARAMERLRRRSYRVIWMNPRAAAPGFEPSVATMAAALPYCDALLPAHTFRSLAAVIAELARER
jgi:uncharacterized protein with von Willebrand factor type A (vWA) domain